MIEKWRCNLDQGGICEALFTDLSKAFDCLVRDFLIDKLEAYGFTYDFLKLINSYLTDRKHRTKIHSSYSSFLDLLIGVPQGSILGPLLFRTEYFLFVHHTTSILAKLSTWCFEHSGDISCSLLVNPSHTDESWEGRNTCMWIYIYIYIYI